MRLYETNRYNDGPDNVLTYVTSRCLDRRLRQASVDKVWKFRDRRDKETKVEVKDGFLGMINPKGKWEQMTPDKAMLERDVPATWLSAESFSPPLINRKVVGMACSSSVKIRWFLPA